jgi:hypothetical protein
MSSDYFSNYIKTLDPVKAGLLNTIREKKQELQQLQTQLFNVAQGTERENLAKQVYAIRSKKELNEDDRKTLQILENKIKNLPSEESIQQNIDELKEEIAQLENKFVSEPFILAPQEMVMYPMFRLDNGLWIYKASDSKGVPTGKYYLFVLPNGVVAERNFEIVTDNNDVPIKLKWYQQNEATYGYRLLFECDLKLKSNVIEIAKPTIIEKEVPQYIDKKVSVQRFIPSLQCLCGWDLTEQLKLVFCKNCSRNLYDVIKKQIEIENRPVLQNSKRKGKWLW